MSTTLQVSRGGIGTGGRGLTTVWHTGQVAPTTTTTGTDTTPVVTETYFARVFIPINTQVTGISLLNGSAVAGNVTVGLYAHNPLTGLYSPVAQSASTAQSGTAAYQQVPFASAVTVQGPGQYFVGIQFDSTSARFRTHILGNFTAFKTTGNTYGTLPTGVTNPNSFTTALGPIADTY